MTFSNQEVPSWEIFQDTMYDLNLPEVLDGTSTSYYPDNLDIKIEDTYSPITYQVCGII